MNDGKGNPRKFGDWSRLPQSGLRSTHSVAQTPVWEPFFNALGHLAVIVSSPRALGPVSARRSNRAKVRARSPSTENIHIPGR
jgi:hypothetical protein